MKKNKGFTLIELLAVIVILAVIALIATPIIMNVISDSKKGAAKDAMYGYVKAVELATTKTITATTDAPSGEYQVKEGNAYQGNTKRLDVTFKGTKPENNYGKIVLASGNVTYAKLKFDGIEVEYDGKEVRSDNFLKTYTIGEVVYFDPTGAVSDCVSGKEWTPSNTGTTCYKWNVVKDKGNNIEMLLDHNTTAKIAWVTKEDYIASGGSEAEYGDNGNNRYGPITIIKQLKKDTSEWSKVETLTSNDNVTRDITSNGTYPIRYNGMKARLISGQEIANIGGDSTWTPSYATGTIYSNHSWLYQNKVTNGNNMNYGYWTDTAYQSSSVDAWRIMQNLHYNYVKYANDFGVRPIVRVLKSNI